LSLLDRLSDAACWEQFYEYKTSLACPKAFCRRLRAFIDAEGYRPVCAAIAAGEPFPLPQKAVISKLSTQKKRTVYTYPEAENTVLKLLTHLLLRQYDGLFSAGLYSFRPGRTAKDAIRRLRRCGQKWAYKADISNYFNSVPVDRLLPMLESALADDPALFSFLRGLLSEPRVIDRGTTIAEEKGVMAGTPLSAFYANLYLAPLDAEFAAAGVPYARYSDDIIVFAETREALDGSAARIRADLAEAGLAVNPAKEQITAPGEGWTFLGFSVRGNTVDIAPATLKKLKGKMRRKARALRRWQRQNDLPREAAAKAFLRIFNRKLFETPADNELSWSRWFFPVINTAESLHAIDLYAQDCLRWLLADTRTKARYNVRYEALKALGYRSLVHEYYADAKQGQAEAQ